MIILAQMWFPFPPHRQGDIYATHIICKHKLEGINTRESLQNKGRNQGD